MSSSKKDSSGRSSKGAWVCPGKPQCKSWETTLCKHLASEIDPMYRGALARMKGSPDGIPDRLSDEEALLPAQERRRLWDFLHTFDGVTQKQKHVIIRRLVDEVEFPEIGKELGVSRQAVEQIYERALKRIGKAWEQYG
jgi:RNA polymerase sigma factor (sigma-70 family)